MNVNDLWIKLPLPSSDLDVFKKDIAEGRVPELPFFIVGQTDLKASIAKKINSIDSKRMQTSLIIADYGNGKTTLLKYLQLFFKTNPNYGISLKYSRADVERTDLVLFLLKIIEDEYLDLLVSLIKEAKEVEILSLVNNYDGNFREIRLYTEALFSKENIDEDIRELILLGSGRYYNKKYFDKRSLPQLHDFNRREILALFLNILSTGKQYVIFAIDEIEKIREKSKIRFNHFLTSYRELVDLFNQINGHYLIVSFTTGVGESEISTANDALYTRVKQDILQIKQLTTSQNLKELIEYLNELFETKANVDNIYASYSRNKTTNNRLAVQTISNLLYAKESKETLEELLDRYQLNELFNETYLRLEKDEAFKNIHRKFFDPLEFYLESVESNGDLNKQERLLVEKDLGRVNYFIFNTYLEDFENEKLKVLNLQKRFPESKIVIFSPITLGLGLSALGIDNEENVIINDYEPQKLFAIFEMFRENYDLQPDLLTVISKYTNQSL